MLFLAGCTVFSGNPAAKWHKTNTEVFTFSLPPTFERASFQNNGNSFVTQFTNQDMTITLNEGAYGGEPLDSLSRYKSYNSQTQLMRGLPVQVVTFDMPPGGGHRFDYAIAASYLRIGLTMYVHCRTKDDYLVATKIFKTVKLKPYQSATRK